VAAIGSAPIPAENRQLGQLDFTLLVIGGVIGDGIFVVGALGAKAMGPAQLVAWLAAGVLAILIAVAFVQCASIDHEVGGSYSYARMAFGPFAGFVAAWTLYTGEWMAVAAFPTAFFNYFQALTGAPDSFSLPVKVALIAGVVALNVRGVRQGARTNDALTMAKLLPLGLLIVAGLVFIVLRTQVATDHLTPFAPMGYGGFSQTLLLVFWTYAGFELAVLPAGEVKSPAKVLPRGLTIGMSIVIVVYLLTALSVAVAAPWQETATSSHPLAYVLEAMLQDMGLPSEFAGRLISLGGMVSIAGVCLVFTLSLARLSYALAQDGFLPSPFAQLHRRYQTPYIGVIFLGLCSLIFSTLFGLGSLLSTAVLLLSLTYVLTALSALRLVSSYPLRALHLPGIRAWLLLAVPASLFLTAQASLTQVEVLSAVLALGLFIYLAHARRQVGRRMMGGSAFNARPHTVWRVQRPS
jgi:amino acid transporter